MAWRTMRHIDHAMVPKKKMGCLNTWSQSGEKLGLIKGGRWSVWMKQLESCPLDAKMLKDLESCFK